MAVMQVGAAGERLLCARLKNACEMKKYDTRKENIERQRSRSLSVIDKNIKDLQRSLRDIKTISGYCSDAWAQGDGRRGDVGKEHKRKSKVDQQRANTSRGGGRVPKTGGHLCTSDKKAECQSDSSAPKCCEGLSAEGEPCRGASPKCVELSSVSWSGAFITPRVGTAEAAARQAEDDHLLRRATPAVEEPENADRCDSASTKLSQCPPASTGGNESCTATHDPLDDRPHSQLTTKGAGHATDQQHEVDGPGAINRPSASVILSSHTDHPRLLMSAAFHDKPPAHRGQVAFYDEWLKAYKGTAYEKLRSRVIHPHDTIGLSEAISPQPDQCRSAPAPRRHPQGQRHLAAELPVMDRENVRLMAFMSRSAVKRSLNHLIAQYNRPTNMIRAEKEKQRLIQAKVAAFVAILCPQDRTGQILT